MRLWLKEIRTRKKLSQVEVADKCGIARTTYSMIETGERDPSPDVAMRIASVLRTRWTYFFAPPTTNRGQADTKARSAS